MVSACVFGVFLFHPDSYFAEYNIVVRNVLMGIAMGTTAIGIFKSPWGKSSGNNLQLLEPQFRTKHTYLNYF